MTCAACGRHIEDDDDAGYEVVAERVVAEHARCCGAPVCFDCWVADRTCADVAACQTRQAEGIFAEVHDCKPPDS